MSTADELRSLLSHHLSSTDDPDQSITREHHLVDHLVEKLRDWEVGDLTHEELLAAFAAHSSDLPRFDFEAWLEENYDDPSDEYEID